MLHSLISHGIVGLVFGVAGFFTGRRGLAKAIADVKAASSAVAAEAKK